VPKIKLKKAIKVRSVDEKLTCTFSSFSFLSAYYKQGKIAALSSNVKQTLEAK
jgi:hypothetical protein